jgi:hypothetical protein
LLLFQGRFFCVGIIGRSMEHGNGCELVSLKKDRIR